MFNFIKKLLFSDPNKDLIELNKRLLNNLDTVYLSFMQLKNTDDTILKAIALQNNGSLTIYDEYITTAEKDIELRLDMKGNKDGSITLSVIKVKND